MSKQTPRPLKLGSIAKAYTDDLAENGEDAMNKRAETVMDGIIARFRESELNYISWAAIKAYCLECDAYYCEHWTPPLRERITAWLKRLTRRA